MSKRFAGFSLNKKPQSAFEKEKAEKAEKDRLEQEKLASVLAEFEEEHGEAPPPSRGGAPPSTVTVPQGNRRHYAAKERSMKSGPGTLEPLGPVDGFTRPVGPPTFNNQMWSGQGGPQLQSRFEPPRSKFEGRAEPEEDPYRIVIAKVSNLPPGIDQESVKELFESFNALQVVKVEVIPPTGPQQGTLSGALTPCFTLLGHHYVHYLPQWGSVSNGRPSVAMKVTFNQSTNYRDLEDAMNKLSDRKYLGRGYYLHLDRWLGPKTKEQPPKLAFGARWVSAEPDTSARPQKQFAPPPDMGGPGARERPREEKQRLVVTVNRPHDAATLRLIHMTAESVIKGGMEFEAALMQDRRVINEERFAWIWDSKHPLNRYYRWTLYRLVCGEPNGPVEIFQGLGEWEGPTEKLPFEFASRPEDIDPDEEDPDEVPDEEIGKRHPHPEDMYPGYVDNASGALNPKARLFFMWLLRNLPCDQDLDAVDVAPFATFAHDHAWHGMDEIIDLLISNIFRPFCWQETDAPEGSEDDLQSMKLRKIATMNALRILSDVVFTTDQAGGKSWKYREGLGKQLVERKVFEFLDKLGRKASPGKVSLTAWQNDINYLVDTWAVDKTFSGCEHFSDVFNAQEKEEERKRERERLARERERAKKTVKVGKAKGDGMTADQMDIDEDPANGSRDEADEGTRLDPVDANLSGAQDVAKDTIGGRDQSHSEDQSHHATKAHDSSAEQQSKASDLSNEPPKVTSEPVAARVRRQRPKAEDMFGSDED
ncbi:hypothetical protein BDV96DRAFT_178152 [Lophiotrema nucula]|uniref:SURP motif domain-containing protein n=1 Tax=Lophiotrema nucula TaxID=690887 RepID=A0A6A5Z077_9PLEO|nr:hypothetical protein BDV96DRAFT_178152 [Lophiotrema nucula]